jgi:site-specific DNA recombinase
MDRPKAILYARVSSEEQTKGFSLRQQLAALREYAAREGFEVLAEEGDEGWSESELVRPALDRVQDLVAAGGVSKVLAQDADRITREPSHRALLDEECERHGCKLGALDDWGDDSEEGQLLKYIRGWVSRQERLKFMERSRRGTFQKVREGKVLGSGVAKYGFAYVLDEAGKRIGLRVEDKAIGVVRRILRMLADGESVNAVRKTLDEAGVPTPARATLGWSRAQIRNIVWDDAYRPHLAGEVGPLVSREVAATLDPNRTYGLWYYNRRDVSRWKERDLTGAYRERWRTEMRDREDGLAVPIPNAGVPLEHVEAAREKLANAKKPSRAGGREWELSAGILRCAGCGAAMRARTVRSRKGGSVRHYYLCQKASAKAGCSHKTNYRAEQLEREVMLAIDDLLSEPGRITRDVDEAIERARRSARDPDASDAGAKTLGRRLEQLAKRRAAYQDQQAAGLMTIPELTERLEELDEDRASVDRELARTLGSYTRLQELEERREALLRMFGTGLRLGLYWFPPHLRRGVYELTGLKVFLHPDGGYAVEGDLDASVVRYTQEVAEFADRLAEADERTRRASLDEVERELERVREESTRLRGAMA